MMFIKNTLISLVGGLILALLGSYLTGYTAAIVLPMHFIKLMLFWDVYVVQFLGFGVLAMVLSYLIAYLTRLNFIFSVVIVFIVAQSILLLSMGGLVNLSWPNILIMFFCLYIGWFTAYRKPRL